MLSVRRLKAARQSLVREARSQVVRATLARTYGDMQQRLEILPTYRGNCVTLGAPVDQNGDPVKIYRGSAQKP